MKNTLEGISGRITEAEEWISELEDRIVEITAEEQNKGKRIEDSLRGLWSIEPVMPSSHLILCHPLLLLPPIPPSIRVFSNESTLRSWEGLGAGGEVDDRG